MYCPSCGSNNQPDVKFCRRCGTGLASVAVALGRKDEERSLGKSHLAELIKSYYSGRHKMLFGAGSVALGVALMGIVYGTGSWGFFWIFLWVFMGLFGNGVHQFTKGWNGWSEASSELKALGYERPPTDDQRLQEEHSRSLLTEPRITESLPPASAPDRQSPPSVTESTTRLLDRRETK